jgi:hypothetical protein
MLREKFMKDTTLDVSEALLRIKVIEKILVDAKITTQEILNQELKLMSKSIIKFILESANVQGNLDEIIDTLDKTQNQL